MANHLAPLRSTASAPAKSDDALDLRFPVLSLFTPLPIPSPQEGQNGTQASQDQAKSLEPTIVNVPLPIEGDSNWREYLNNPPAKFSRTPEHRRNVIEGISQVHNLVGQKIVHTIVFLDQDSSSTLDPETSKLLPLLIGRVYYIPDQGPARTSLKTLLKQTQGPTIVYGVPSPETDEQPSNDYARIIGRHEAYHGVFQLVSPADSRNWQALFDQFKSDKKRRIRFFHPLSEGNFFSLSSAGGHPEDNPDEFFASLMNSTHHPNLQVRLASVKGRFLKNYALSLKTALDLVSNSNFSESELPQHIQRALTLVDTEIKRRAAPATSASRPSPSPND